MKIQGLVVATTAAVASLWVGVPAQAYTRTAPIILDVVCDRSAESIVVTWDTVNGGKPTSLSAVLTNNEGGQATVSVGIRRSNILSGQATIPGLAGSGFEVGDTAPITLSNRKGSDTESCTVQE